jgi:four helix bundle protein
MGVKQFEDLHAWQLSAEVRDKVVALCANDAFKQDVEFRNQLRDAACGAPRLIAEGFGRFTHREFKRYLRMARAEMLETKNHLGDLRARRYVADRIVDDLMDRADHAQRTIARLRSSLGGDKDD